MTLNSCPGTRYDDDDVTPTRVVRDETAVPVPVTYMSVDTFRDYKSLLILQVIVTRLLFSMLYLAVGVTYSSAYTSLMSVKLSKTKLLIGFQ